MRMRMRKFGSSGLFVSELSFGAMPFGGTEGIWGQVGKLGQEEADVLVKAALDAGINLFDTANIYANGRSEQILGQSLRNLGVAREDMVIATKVHGAMGEGPNRRGASRGHIMSAVGASLRRLQMDHIDLYQLHGFDPTTSMEETLEALDTLVRAGDVRYIRLSNWAAWQIMKAVGIIQQRQPAQIAIAWLLRQPFVSTVLIGAKRISQLQENVAATEIALDNDDMAKLDTVSRLPIEYPGWSLGN